MPESGPYYSFAQLEYLWIAAGGAVWAAAQAAAVALAESGGAAGATNPTDNGGRQTSWGLWQISNGTHNMPTPDILDPNTNASAAVAKFNAAGGTFARDWGTYGGTAYLHYLQQNAGVLPSNAGLPAGTPTAATLTVAPSAGSGNSSTVANQLAPDTDQSCLVGFSGILGTSGFCILTKTEVRAMLAGLMLAGGTVIMVVGVVTLITGEFGGPAVAQAASQAAGVPVRAGLAAGRKLTGGKNATTPDDTEATSDSDQAPPDVDSPLSRGRIIVHRRGSTGRNVRPSRSG